MLQNNTEEMPRYCLLVAYNSQITVLTLLQQLLVREELVSFLTLYQYQLKVLLLLYFTLPKKNIRVEKIDVNDGYKT